MEIRGYPALRLLSEGSATTLPSFPQPGPVEASHSLVLEDATGAGEVNVDVVVGRAQISKSFPTPQILERPEDVPCLWMDGREQFILSSESRKGHFICLPLKAAGLRPVRKMLEHSDLPSEAFGCGLLITHTQWGQGCLWILKAHKEIMGGSTRAGEGGTVVYRQMPSQ